MLKTVYVIRHAEQLKIDGKIKSEDNEQILNEKIILTANGEKCAEKLSNCGELSNIDELWSSNYVRAISTAKYIAIKNKIAINIDEDFGERKLGDLEELKKLGTTKINSYTLEQLLDCNLTNIKGESRREVQLRMTKALQDILANTAKRIAIVSHGAAIKFLLMNWCTINNETFNIEYNGSVIAEDKLPCPAVFKLEFENNKLIDIIRLNLDSLI